MPWGFCPWGFGPASIQHTSSACNRYNKLNPVKRGKRLFLDPYIFVLYLFRYIASYDFILILSEPEILMYNQVCKMQ